MGIKSYNNFIAGLNNIVQNSYDNFFASSPISATGGTIYTPGDGYKYHVFTSSGTFAVTSGNGAAEIIAIGGGGGGVLRCLWRTRR
jgi:hypothetical protein